MHPFRSKAALSWLLLAVLLTGCGQKGPLYLPKPSSSSTSSVSPDQSQTAKP